MEPIRISPGDKIELQPMLSDGTFSPSSYASQIQDTLSDNEFQTLPLSENNVEEMVGRVFQVTLIRVNEAHVGVAKVEKTVSEGSLVFLQFVFTQNLSWTQRRNFYRLKIELEIDIDGQGKFKTYDLSGGGLSFMSPKKFDNNELLGITLELMGDEFLVRGAVVRCQEVSSGKYFVAVCFRDIKEMVQDEIARFVQKRQTTLIKKGILER